MLKYDPDLLRVHRLDPKRIAAVSCRRGGLFLPDPHGQPGAMVIVFDPDSFWRFKRYVIGHGENFDRGNGPLPAEVNGKPVG